MKIVFRADASLDIGTGHIMRCLTLADALKSKGAECHFICREHVGHLIAHVRIAGHEAHSLPLTRSEKTHAGQMDGSAPKHAQWLGVSQQEDALDSINVLKRIQPDWLVVDHYALDFRWESELRPYADRLMVIDDLADRTHDCDLLLDQTYGRDSEEYRLLVPEACSLLCGSLYALLRPEFAQWRSYSLARRARPELGHLLITMGGVDRDNVTGRILETLAQGCLPESCCISIVMGENAPWLDPVRQTAAQLPWRASVIVGVKDMARLMAESDLAIGAAGATAWERCCLGLPTLLMVLADNQQAIAQSLQYAGAAQIIDQVSWKHGVVITELLSERRRMTDMARAASEIVDGMGAERLVYKIYG
ncbi:UDP-2,4-diacetamido-2,4,6-trideoxy-beta-L-altropyranose hydrolase [Castellaniella ginsengisoli]|uniref:UDP-2,4-diacetamido-2,4, 6-trideoxy-beta-L-altropyranose hydrolase n=1 Tax=Castellaniella ginsengisoli TaxID=546114 RepID=A0AB39D4C7_9BURK